MGKVNPYAGRRVDRRVYKREYEDAENHPGETITLWLRPPDAPDWGKIGDLQQRMTRKYVTGDETDGDEAVPFPPVGGEIVEVSEGLCQIVAIACVMQRPPESADRYTFDEMIGLSVSYPQAWKRIQKDVRDLIKSERLDEKKSDVLPSASNGSSPASSNSILSISSEPTPSSAQ